MTEKLSTQEQAAIIKLAKTRFKEGEEAWGHFFRDARKIQSFISDEQWDPQLRNAREAAGLPVLSVNTLSGFVNHISNEMRQNTPSIQITPKDDDADEDTAEILADHIRSIQQESDAETMYDQTGKQAVSTGLGFLRVLNEYESTESFLQKLIIRAIDDPESVIIDPNHLLADGSDSEWVFIIDTLTEEEYERSYPKSQMSMNAANSGWSSNYSKSDWSRKGSIRIAEYYYREYKDETLYKVLNVATNNTVISTETPPKEMVDIGSLIILDKRPVKTPVIKWAKINDKEVLEQTEWPGTTIPVVTVKGEETWIGGKRYIKGAVKDAVDSQRALNYFFSLQSELVSLAPKAPWVGEVRQFKNFEQLWQDSATSSIAFLPYNEVTGLPPPARAQVSADIAAASQTALQCKDNIKQIFGIYDASLGANGNEVSGKAILARTEQSHTASYHFYDNLTKAVQQLGNILVEVIPVFYSEDRKIQTLKENGAASITQVNGESRYQLGKGKYGVVVETGPTYATKRQDAVNHMLTLMEQYPQSAPLMADIVVDEMDWPGAKRIAKRLAMALPPEIQQAEAQDGKVSPAQQASMAISQVKMLTQQMQQLQMRDQEMTMKLHNLVQENALLKTKADVDLEKASMDGKIKQAQIMLDSREAQMSYDIEMKKLAFAQEQLEVQKQEMGIKATSAAAELLESAHEHTKDHIGTMHTMATGEVVPGVKVMKITAPDKDIGSEVSGEDVGNA